MLYSPTHRQAIENNCRYLCYTGMDVDMMVRTIGRQNYAALTAFTAKIRELSTMGTKMRVTNPNGMDLSWMVNKNPPAPGWLRVPGKGYSQMLGGQGHAPAVQNTINGTLVFDGAVWPPEELGALRDPIVMTVQDGAITAVKGGPEARTFERWLRSFNHEAMFKVAHCSYGFNPGITRITGRIVEDERIFGSMEYGVGPTALGAPSHTDGIVLNPSVHADDVPLEKDGVYVHAELVAICKQMGVPGY
jgi:leucyl aminopeptidase (aminopeptidase T)